MVWAGNLARTAARGACAVAAAIAGRRPAPEIEALASERVTVTGTVGDVRPFYARAAAVIVPLRVGSGTRLKILEAMAAGVPVISTARGAEGLKVEQEKNILLADTPEEITTAVRNLISSPETAMHLATEARSLVRRVYDWPILGSGFIISCKPSYLGDKRSERLVVPFRPLQPHYTIGLAVGARQTKATC